MWCRGGSRITEQAGLGKGEHQQAQALINKAPKLSLERRVKAELFFLIKLNESFAFQGKYFTGNIQERILKGIKKGAKKGTFMAP